MEQVVSLAERHRPLLDELIATGRPSTTPTSTVTCSSRRSSSPARRTRGTSARVARTSSCIRPGWRGSSPSCDAPRRRSPPGCSTTSSRTPTRRSSRYGRLRRGHRSPRRGRHQAHPDLVPEPGAGAGRELPQDDRRDGQGPEVIIIKLADRSTTCGRSSTWASRSSCRRPGRRSRCTRRSPTGSASTNQVGARGPRLPDPAPAQVRGDRGHGGAEAQRAGGVRR